MAHTFTINYKESFYNDYELTPLPIDVIDRAGLPVNVESNRWKINEATCPAVINLNKLNLVNLFLDYAIKRYLIQRIKQVSPRETINCWYSLKLLATTERWQELRLASTAETTENILPALLSELLEKLRREKAEDRFHRIRAWYIWCTEQELPGFSPEIMYDLLKIKLPGNEKGRAVMLEDAEQGPLLDIEVNALRNALTNDSGALAERICVWLCLAFGCNPANCIFRRKIGSDSSLKLQ